MSKQVRSFFVISLLVFAALAAVAPAASAKPLSKCQRLERLEKDISKAKAFVLVLRNNAEGGRDLLGCRLPAGKVRTLASTSDDGVNSEKLSVEKVSGPWALFDIDEDGTAGTSPQTSLANVGTGRVFRLGGSSCTRPLGGMPCTSGRLLRIRFSARGRALVMQSANAGVQVIGYNTRAQPTLLDEGPSAALPVADVRFSVETALWKHSGELLSAVLNERSCKLSGTDLAPAEDVVLVRRAAESEDGEPGSELVGCVKPAGPNRVVGTAGSFGLGTETADALSVAGSWVLAGSSASNQYGAAGALEVADLRSERSYSVYSYNCSIGSCEGMPTLSAALINDRGQSATVQSFQGQSAVIAFTSTGTRRVLDSGPSAELPASSLRLTGSTASWTRNGEARSFVITEG